MLGLVSVLNTLQEVNGLGFDSEGDMFIVALYKNGIAVCEYEMTLNCAKTLVKSMEKIINREKHD